MKLLTKHFDLLIVSEEGIPDSRLLFLQFLGCFLSLRRYHYYLFSTIVTAKLKEMFLLYIHIPDGM